LTARSEPARGSLRAVSSTEPETTLAERLRQGPLSIAYALQCATDIAAAMRQMHAQGRTHGRVCAEAVLLRETSARLAPGPGTRSQGEDVAAFGTLLYQLLHGCEPPAEVAVKSLDNVIAAATDVAYRCLNCTSGESSLDMRRAVTEIRVLALLARQRAANPTTPVATAAAVPPPSPALPVLLPEFELHPVRCLAPTDEACPKCGSHYVYDSKPRTWLESFTRKAGVSLHRCHRCYHRYCTVMGVKVSKNAPIG
jgi:hypothetical protein